VTGAIDPKRIWANGGAQAGDRILLTKPIGTGVIGTAAKNRRAPAETLAQAIESMRTLNRAPAEALADSGAVHACTDITGFGLIGHASEVANASGVTVVIEASKVPLFDGVRALVRRNRNGGMASNREYFGGGVKLPADIDADLVDLLYDPQTSGGLLAFVAADRTTVALDALKARGVAAVEVGHTVAPTGHWIEVR
jgi:selenide,water dikinase